MPDEAAIRECYEETGIKPLKLQKLIKFHPGLDTVYCPHYLYYTNKISNKRRILKENQEEIMESVWLSLNDCMKLINNSEIKDGFTIMGIMAYKIKLNN